MPASKKTTKKKGASTKKADKTTIVKAPEKKNPNAKQRKLPKYKPFSLQKKIKHPAAPLPSAIALAKTSLLLMKANWRQLAVFVAVYFLLTLLFVRGFGSPVDFNEISTTFNEFLEDDLAGLASGFTTFGILVNSSVQGVSEISQLYQTILMIIMSLAIIWLYRQQQAGNDVTMKMAFYRGMYPLVPFTLVFVVVGLHLLPATIGNFVFASVFEAGLIVGGMEMFLWIVFLVASVVLSLYLLASSIIALYIVTLPEMTPMHALKQAKSLVQHRRSSVVRKLVLLLIMLLLVLFIVVLPLIFFSPLIAEWLLLLLTLLALPFAHGYLYALYRELL